MQPPMQQTRGRRPSFALVMQGLLAVIGLRLALPGSSLSERAKMESEWLLWLQAFGIACVIWAVISAVRAPFIVRAEDSQKGRWVNANRFVFYEPLLIGMFHCKATGDVEKYRFTVPFVEPGAWIDCHMTLTPDVRKRAAWSLGAQIMSSPMMATQWPGTCGFRLEHNRTAALWIKLEPQTVSTTVRIFCRSYSIGEWNDDDGTTGNYKFSV